MHVGWCAARPEGSEGGEGYGVREPDRKETSGRGVRDDLLIVAWQPFLCSWQNYNETLFNSIYYALFGSWGLALLFLNDQNKSVV